MFKQFVLSTTLAVGVAFAANAQTPTAPAVITEMLAHAQIPSGLVRYILTIADGPTSYTHCGMMTRSTATAQAGTVTYNTIAGTGNATEIKLEGNTPRVMGLAFGWYGATPVNTIGAINLTLANGVKKSYSVSKNATVRVYGNGYMLTETTTVGKYSISIYLEKGSIGG